MSRYEDGVRKRGDGDRPSIAPNHESTVVRTSIDINVRLRRLARAVRRVARKGRAIGASARRRLGGEGEAGGVRPENVVWIFGAGRTGSTWLARMMEELEGYTVWFEPRVGLLFDPYHLRLEDRKGKHFILSPRYRGTWLRSIRSFVLDGAGARFPEVSKDGYLVIKEPGGSAGAPLLMEALPESRMILLVRDPRDIVASGLDAARKGGWQYEQKKSKGQDSGSLVDEDPNAYVKAASKIILQEIESAKQAYDAHKGRKTLIRYEELRADTLGTMRRIYSELGLPVDGEKLLQVAEKHSWDNIPEEKKGDGKFYRKAKPGGWREDLTSEQAEMVERIAAPLLEEFYPEEAT